MTWLADVFRRVFQFFFRMVPCPTETRVIVVGRPDRRSPVLLTTNCDFTVRRVMRALRGLNCYLLVAPAGGLDVWCAAAGGRLTIDSVISILKTSRIAELVDHRRMLLPKLAAAGINIFELRRRTGWFAAFGPVTVEQVPEYLVSRKPNAAASRVGFSIEERVEMASAMWGSLGLRFSLFPVLLMGWPALPWFLSVLLFLSMAVSLGCFRLPGKTFVQKAALPGIILTGAAVAGLSARGHLHLAPLAATVLLIGFASFLVGSSFPSYSPYWPCGYSRLFYGACDLKVSVIEEQCIGCRVCDQVCPVDCFAPTARRTMEVRNPDHCVGCGACLIQCPTDAIVNDIAVAHRKESVCA